MSPAVFFYSCSRFSRVRVVLGTFGLFSNRSLTVRTINVTDSRGGFRGVATPISLPPLKCPGGGDATPWAFQKNKRDMIYMRGKKVLNGSKMAKKVGLN